MAAAPTTVTAATRITRSKPSSSSSAATAAPGANPAIDGDGGHGEQLAGAGDGVVDAGGDAGVVVVDGAEGGGRQRGDGQRQAEPEHDDAGQDPGDVACCRR